MFSGLILHTHTNTTNVSYRLEGKARLTNEGDRLTDGGS